MGKRKAFCLIAAVVLLSALILVAASCGKKQDQDSGSADKPQVPSETKMVSVGDIDIAYRVYGNGYPLIMIMGFSGTQDIWDPTIIQDLADEYQVITFDNRGMGATTAGGKQFTIEQFADDTAELMNALGIAQADILAWSMGTNIAEELALRYPELVNKLILYAADPGGPQAIQPSDEVMRKLTDASGTPEERGARMIAIMLPPDWLAQNQDYIHEVFSRPMETASPENIAKQAVAMGSWGGCYNRLSQIKSPTMLLTGTSDIMTPPENSMLMVEKIPGAWLVQISGGGHGVMFQDPDYFSEIVMTFLR
jgi:pimeloyl-ACP methyl ester carboxylesterase